MMTKIRVTADSLEQHHIFDLLSHHRREMLKHSPPESVHALKAEDLSKPNLQFWSAWIEDDFVGCGALKELDASHGEIKSMKTVDKFLRRGVARAVLAVIIIEAKKRRYTTLSLETGSMDVFVPARRLYLDFGFIECPPFADYVEDPNSVCMSLTL